MAVNINLDGEDIFLLTIVIGVVIVLSVGMLTSK